MASDYRSFEVLKLLVFLAILVVVQSHQHHQDSSALIRERRDERPGHEYALRIRPRPLQTRKPPVDDRRPIPVIYDDSHCKNGGTGYLGAFCLCPQYFTGRYCETDIRNTSSCDHLDNGEWVYRDCHLCFCDNGRKTCQFFRLEGCDEEKETPSQSVVIRLSASMRLIFPLLIVGLVLSTHPFGVLPWR